MFLPSLRQVFWAPLAAAILIPSALFAEELNNAGFEQGIQGWVTSPEDAAAKLSQVVPEAAHSGSMGLRVKQDASGPGSWLQSGRVSVDASKAYQLHFWARAVEESGIGVWVQFYDTDRKPIKTASQVMIQIVPNAKDWQEYTLPLQTPAGAVYVTVAVHSFSKQACLADFDDFSIVDPSAPAPASASAGAPATASAPSAVPTLPLNNPGFEEGTQCWVTSPEDAAAKLSQVVSEAAHSGSMGLRVKQDASGPGSWLQSGRVSVDASKAYQLHFWARAVEESGIGVWVQFYDTDRKPIKTASQVMIQIVPNAKDWQEYTLPFQTPEGAAYVTMAVHSFSKQACLADFDDFSIVAPGGGSASAMPVLLIPKV